MEKANRLKRFKKEVKEKLGNLALVAIAFVALAGVAINLDHSAKSAGNSPTPVPAFAGESDLDSDGRLTVTVGPSYTPKPTNTASPTGTATPEPSPTFNPDTEKKPEAFFARVYKNQSAIGLINETVTPVIHRDLKLNMAATQELQRTPRYIYPGGITPTNTPTFASKWATRTAEAQPSMTPTASSTATPGNDFLNLHKTPIQVGTIITIASGLQLIVTQ